MRAPPTRFPLPQCMNTGRSPALRIVSRMRSMVASFKVLPWTDTLTYSSPRTRAADGSSKERGSIGSRRSSRIPPPAARNRSRSAAEGCPPVTRPGTGWHAFGTSASASKGFDMPGSYQPGGLLGRRLPDVHAHAVRTHHRIALMAAEGPGELRHVGQRAVDPEGIRSVHIHRQQQAGELRPDVAAPDLGPPHEEPLLAGEPVDGGRPRLALERALVRPVGDEQAAKVGDVLAQGVLA